MAYTPNPQDWDVKRIYGFLFDSPVHDGLLARDLPFISEDDLLSLHEGISSRIGQVAVSISERFKGELEVEVIDGSGYDLLYPLTEILLSDESEPLEIAEISLYTPGEREPQDFLPPYVTSSIDWSPKVNKLRIKIECHLCRCNWDESGHNCSRAACLSEYIFRFVPSSFNQEVESLISDFVQSHVDQHGSELHG